MKTLQLIVISVTFLSTSSGILFKPKNMEAGITFNELNRAAITHTTWQLLYYYDLSDYFIQIEKIQLIIDQIDRLCEISSQNQDCPILLELLKTHMENSKINADQVESFNSSRKKRWAPLGYIGDLYALVFGFMTQEDAEAMTNNIRKLQEKVISHQKLFENQLLIAQQMAKWNNNTYIELKNNIEQLSSQINVVERNRSIDTHITSLTQIATLIIQGHNQVSNTLTNVLQNSVNGKIINLISRKQLRQDLQTITENLKNNQKLPIDLKNQHVFNIFSVTTSKATLHKRKILLLLNIPIVERDELKLFKAIPIPIKRGKKPVIIAPSTEYFLLNAQKRELTPMSSEDLEKCKKTSRNELICTPESPTIINKDNSCELSLLLNSKIEIIEKLCDFRSILDKNYIIKIGQNKYYCVITSPISLSETCPNGTLDAKSLTINGILEIEPGCSLLTNELKITADNTIQTETQTINPPFSLKNLNIGNLLDTSARISQILEKNYSTILVNDFNKESIEISANIAQNLEKAKEKIDIQDMIYESKKETYTTIIICILVFLSLIVCYNKCIK